MSKKYAKYAFSQDEYKEVDENSPLYAVDCEMCLTNIGKLELTKVCVVDSDLNEIYQSLVKPRNRIVNYLTRFSGITEAILENVETRLEDVQQALKKLLPPGKHFNVCSNLVTRQFKYGTYNTPLQSSLTRIRHS